MQRILAFDVGDKRIGVALYAWEVVPSPKFQ